ncbi:Retrovirus-related Pol polyprotein from transposon TNT 1-94 [Gossypium australe]|uniref:Retrovirus-related Pol polyprotein from transposon TNT 1-94 n=1 Tax=Gossypium australe TaxID=47621 RepID=A0A5B6URX4_9ROSI|nr:Retrovirus-related Pol polyprotein from transposon TNT 1-94 [Gossypium australe]
MKESETIKEHSDRLLGIVNNARLFDTDFFDSRIVQKLLVTIPESKYGQFGRVKKICKSPQHQGEVNAAQNLQDGEQMLVASYFTTSSSTESWLIDRCCTTMSYDHELFKELHQTIVSRVRIGNRAYIVVEGKKKKNSGD